MSENPYLQIPKPEDTRDIIDRYQHANKTEACWQTKWDLIHCIMGTKCVQKDDRKASDCLADKQSDVHSKCKALMTGLHDCRNSQLNNRHRYKGKRGHHNLAVPNVQMFGGVNEDE